MGEAEDKGDKDTTLVAKDDPGMGILVDGKGGRPIGDTTSSSVFIEELPLNFIGGDEALHFALGKLFGQFGKIKKIELYMEKGTHADTLDFKGEALVVYHPSKLTGKREKGDPVWDACTHCDGKWCLLGFRHSRIRCEAAVWQKEGYDVKANEKLFPCVEISNLWEYDSEKPLGYYMDMQDIIRKHAAETAESPFCKVDPMSGVALVWFKGAKDCMRFASQMHKSYFMGRKVQASLCRRPKPRIDDWDGVKDHSAFNNKVDDAIAKARAAGTFTLFPKAVDKNAAPPPPGPPLEPMEVSQAFADMYAEDIAALPEDAKIDVPKPLPFRLKNGTRVRLKDLEAKPENNGKTGDVVKWLPDIQKYQVQLDFDKKVKVKLENLEVLDELSTTEQMFTCEHKAAKREDKEEEALKAAIAARMMAEKMNKPKALVDATAADFEATVCVDPSLLKKTAEEEQRLKDEEDKKAEDRRRQRSRSRERIQRERIEAAQARLAAEGGPRSKWIVPSPQELAAQAAKAGAENGSATTAPPKEPEESREELMKLPVAKLKALLAQFGKHARGCLEKKDFVDRLKPPPKE